MFLRVEKRPYDTILKLPKQPVIDCAIAILLPERPGGSTWC